MFIDVQNSGFIVSCRSRSRTSFSLLSSLFKVSPYRTYAFCTAGGRSVPIGEPKFKPASVDKAEIKETEWSNQKLACLGANNGWARQEESSERRAVGGEQ